jgi:hypothetical protein
MSLWHVPNDMILALDLDCFFFHCDGFYYLVSTVADTVELVPTPAVVDCHLELIMGLAYSLEVGSQSW